jgi:hypothetical protein
MRIILLGIALFSIPTFAFVLDAYSDSRDCYSLMGKYEEIAVWSDLYHRSVAVTPPDYAKVFLPTSGY